MSNIAKTAALSTMGLGLSQALVPQQAGQVFGLGRVTDGSTLWLARLVGVANVTIGSLLMNDAVRKKVRPQQVFLLSANAAVTTMAMTQGQISKRTGASVLGFIGLLAVAVVTED